METISSTFNKFLKYKKKDVKKTTYNKYDDILFLFKSFLNGYAYNYLDEDDLDLFETKFNQENKEFCEIFGIDKIDVGEIEEFMGYFLIRKVLGGKESIKYSGTVLRQLLKWLKNNSYIGKSKFDELIDIVDRLKDELTKVLEVTDILYEETTGSSMKYGIFPFDKSGSNNLAQYETTRESVFYIKDIKKGKLWLGDLSAPSETIGPVIVPDEVSSLANEGWQLHLAIGKKGNKWDILESGDVYPG